MAETVTDLTPKTDPTLDIQKSVYGKRYVGAKEIIMLFLTSEFSEFSFESYLSYFLLNIFGIDARVLAVYALAEMTWDILNDSLFAYFIDRTRTRFGKFKPWGFAAVGPFTIVGMSLWLSPLLLGDHGWSATSWQKITIYCTISVLKETLGTLYSCVMGGLESTFTPSMDDKAAMITFRSVFGFSSLSKYFAVILIDLAASGKTALTTENVYMGLGAGTVLLAGLAGFLRLCIIKERVVQVEERPKFIDGMRNFFGNRLQVAVTLSNFLFAFGSVKGPFHNLFWLDVMGSASLQVVSGIPAAPVTYLSYAIYPKLRKKLNLKQCWFIGNLLPQISIMLVFILGMNDLDNTYYILALISFHEVVFSSVYALSHITPKLMSQEVIDYGEWKTGKRTEAMTGFIAGLATKLVSTVQNAISTSIVSFIGYNAGVNTVQTMQTKKAIFAMFTIIPVVLGILGYIPMLFYNLDDTTRERMYRELEERRLLILRKSQEHVLEVENIGEEI